MPESVTQEKRASTKKNPKRKSKKKPACALMQEQAPRTSCKSETCQQMLDEAKVTNGTAIQALIHRLRRSQEMAIREGCGAVP